MRSPPTVAACASCTATAIYLRSYQDPRGDLVSASGRAARIDPYGLSIGPQTRVECYAPEELTQCHGRPTAEEFEA